MTTIFEEFRHLAGADSEAIKWIDTLEQNASIEPKERRQIALYAWTLICPECPPGQRHARDSFWGQASTKFVYWGLFGHLPEKKAAWLHAQRTRNTSNPHFEPIPKLPQPTARIY